MMIQTCEICENGISRGKFCSYKCYWFSLKGRELTLEHKEKIKNSSPKGENNRNWRGDKASYGALHFWIRRQLGKPNRCDECKTLTPTKFEWANISMNYKRDITDWRPLCVSCHKKEGYARGELKSPKSVFKIGHIPWSKGKHTGNHGNGFKKNHIPWNKGVYING